MDGGELLEASHAPKPKHRPLPPSKRLVRILRAIVEPATGFLPVEGAKLTQRRAIGTQSIRQELISRAVPLQCFLEEFQCRLLVPPFGDETLENLAFVIDGAPKGVLLAVDLYENLIQMPPPAGQ